MSLVDQIRDPYDRTARVTPALLVALPVLIPLVCVYGAKHPLLVAVVGVMSTCGVVYALSSIARGRGKELEEKLVAKWGGMPTTISLRHRDRFFDSVTKKRYHQAIVQKLGIPIPSPEAEAADPGKADETYIGATRRLRELTRKDKALLLKENIAYGFHRNMLAMKGPGILTSVVGLIYAMVIARVLVLNPLGFHAIGFADPSLAGGVSLAISLLLLLGWVFYFDERKVRQFGFTYAERLFEYLPKMPSAVPRGKKSEEAETGAC